MKHFFKRQLWITLPVLLVLCLASCGKKIGAETEGDPGRTGAADGEEASWEVFEFAEDIELEWRDNSKDAYMATVNIPIDSKPPEPEGKFGRLQIAITENKAVLLRDFKIPESNDSVDGGCLSVLQIATDGKETYSLVPDGFQQKEDKERLDNIGAVLGEEDRFLLFTYLKEGERLVHYFFQVDENLQTVHEWKPEFLTEGRGQQVSYPIVDGQGNLHFMIIPNRSQGGTAAENHYYILSPDGELLFDSTDLSGFDSLIPICGERVAIAKQKLERETSGNLLGIYFQKADLETGELEDIAYLDNSGTKEDPFAWTYAMPDEDTILYVGRKGIYSYDVGSGKSKTLYSFVLHGLDAVPEKIGIRRNGHIAMVYQDADGYNYLDLKPTDEEVGIKTVILALPDYRREAYRRAVIRFNKKYPTYSIELRSDYDESALLTELTAGSGPVLVDTELTGFEELKELWQPLDGIIRQLGYEDELNPKAVEGGRIGKRLYGIVTEFSLYTLAVSDPAVTDWDYQGFLDYIGAHPDMEAVMDYYGYPEDFVMLFANSLEDSYLFDAGKGTTVFGTEEFDRILDIAERYVKEGVDSDEGKALLDGRILCSPVEITFDKQLIPYRFFYLDKGIRFLGYPTKEGAQTFLESAKPLAVRKTATEEEKKIAYTFIRILLSYESLMDMVENGMRINQLSVRKDVLEEQIRTMAEGKKSLTARAYNLPSLNLRGGKYEDTERDRQILTDLIGRAQPKKKLPKPLEKLMREELEEYFKGNIDRETLKNRLDNRVTLYLRENMD